MRNKDFKITYPVDPNDTLYFDLEVPSKGYLLDVKVVIDNKTFNLSFYDPVRLAQDLESENEYGNIALIEKNLIVIPEVTKDNIEKAINQAIKEGYFDE